MTQREYQQLVFGRRRVLRIACCNVHGDMHEGFVSFAAFSPSAFDYRFPVR